MNYVSSKCISFIKSFEGFSPTVYNDMVGVPTLGYGMTGSEIKGLTSVTEAKATEMLIELVNRKYAKPIVDDLASRNVALNQYQLDALVSMAYNVGIHGLLSSTLYSNVCKGIRDSATITSNFLMWNKAGGRVVAGLTRRRQEEAKMFLTYVKTTPTSGRVICPVLNVRAKATTDSAIIGKLRLGNSVKIAKQVGDFYDIYFGDHGGYVCIKYIK